MQDSNIAHKLATLPSSQVCTIWMHSFSMNSLEASTKVSKRSRMWSLSSGSSFLMHAGLASSRLPSSFIQVRTYRLVLRKCHENVVKMRKLNLILNGPRNLHLMTIL